MKNKIIGRINEIEIFNKIMKTSEPQLMALYGRRRVGKTYLIDNYFSGNPVFFEMTGIHNGNMSSQLEIFHKSLHKTFKSAPYI